MWVYNQKPRKATVLYTERSYSKHLPGEVGLEWRGWMIVLHLLYIKVPQAVGTSASGGDMGGGGADSGEGKKSGVTLNGMPTMFED